MKLVKRKINKNHLAKSGKWTKYLIALNVFFDLFKSGWFGQSTVLYNMQCILFHNVVEERTNEEPCFYESKVK